MQPISEEFKQTIKESHVVVVRAELLDPNGDVIMELPVTDGYITVDSDADVLRSARMVIAGEPDEEDQFPLVPETMFDLLAPGRNEIRPYRGVRLGAGTVSARPISEEISTTAEWETGEHDWTQASDNTIELRF